MEGRGRGGRGREKEEEEEEEEEVVVVDVALSPRAVKLCARKNSNKTLKLAAINSWTPICQRD